MDKPFWEKTYADISVATFGKRPAGDLMKMTSSFKKDMKALDIGCGEGRNAIYLAELGLDVDAFDISVAGIKKLKKIAVEKGVKVKAWVQDLTNYVFDKKYDVIICHGVLHLVEKHEWQRMIKNIKINTNPGGLNIIGVSTKTLPVAPDLLLFTKALFNEGELKEFYSDWNIVDYNAYVFEDEHPGGVHHKHAANNIIAIKY